MSQSNPSDFSPITLYPYAYQTTDGTISGSYQTTVVVQRFGAEILSYLGGDLIGDNLTGPVPTICFERLSVLQQQVNTYYASVLIDQSLLNNLNICLDDVSGGDYTGTTTMTFTTAVYDATAGTVSYTTFQTTVEGYMTGYLTTSWNTSTASGTQTTLNQNTTIITNQISLAQNNIQTQQTFMNSSVTSIDSDESYAQNLASQLISTVQSILSHIQ